MKVSLFGGVVASASLLLVTGLAGPVTASSTDRGLLVATSGSPMTVGTTPYSLVVGDVNNDNLDDLVTSNTNGSGVSVLLSDGEGGFSAAAGSPFTAAHPAEIRMGFVNGDAWPDLVTIEKNPNVAGQTDYLVTLLGTGSGAFAAGVQGPVIGPAAGDGLVLGDFTGDEVLDAAYTNTFSLSTTFQHVFGVLEGGGDGTWTQVGEYVDREAAYPATNAPTAIEAGDVDGDLDLDLVLANTGSKDVSVWINDGSGNFTRPNPPTPIGRFTGDMVVADVTGDTKVDIVVANATYYSLTVLIGDGAGSFSSAAWSPISMPDPAYDLALGDVNDDGFDDLAVGYYSATVRLMLGDGTGHFSPGWGTSYDVANLSDVQMGDFDNDGYSDIGTTNNSANTVSAWLSTLDNDPPTTSIQTNPSEPVSGWFTGTVSVAAYSEDVGAAGVATQKCSTDPGVVPTTYAQLSTTCQGSFDLTTDGVHTVYAAAIDGVGNAGTVVSKTIQIDKTAPSMSPSVSPSTVVQGESATASPNASDSGSGLADATCDPVDTSTLGSQNVSCIAHDVAGNETTQDASYLVVAPNAGVEATFGKDPGTQLRLDITVSSDGSLDAGDLVVTLPASLRYDGSSGLTDCAFELDQLTCPVGAMTAGGTSELTVLATPGSPGPHQATVSITGSDGDSTDNSTDATASLGLVCDNSPTGGSDTVVGTSGGEILCGGSGNDLLRGLGGEDLIFGGPGVDTISFAGATAISVDLRSQGLDTPGAFPLSGADNEADWFTGIERAIGTSYGDYLIGNGSANRLVGGGGGDVIKGLGGQDLLEGGGGADLLIGGSGHDTLKGGTGRDTCKEASDTKFGCEL